MQRNVGPDLGKIHLGLLAILIFFLGIYFDQWWWRIGALAMAVMLILAFNKYRTDI